MTGAEFAASPGGGAAIGAGGGILGGLVGFGISQSLASDAWDRQKDWATRGPTYMRKGLVDAGYNPILALTGGQIPRANAPQGQLPNTNIQIDPKAGAANQLMKLQGDAAVATAGNQVAQAALATSRAQTLTGDIAESRALQGFLATPEGIAWVATKFKNQALPNTMPAAGIRLLEGAKTRAERWNIEEHERFRQD